MGNVVELWPHQAVNKGMAALSEFQKTGSREGFKKWREEYGDKIEHEKKAIIDTLIGERPMNKYTPVENMKRDAGTMAQDKWYEKHGDELWIIYHEEGANYDTDYEDWCEKQYEKYSEGGSK